VYDFSKYVYKNIGEWKLNGQWVSLMEWSLILNVNFSIKTKKNALLMKFQKLEINNNKL
jgi:hypothetical protein